MDPHPRAEPDMRDGGFRGAHEICDVNQHKAGVVDAASLFSVDARRSTFDSCFSVFSFNCPPRSLVFLLLFFSVDCVLEGRFARARAAGSANPM